MTFFRYKFGDLATPIDSFTFVGNEQSWVNASSYSFNTYTNTVGTNFILLFSVETALGSPTLSLSVQNANVTFLDSNFPTSDNAGVFAYLLHSYTGKLGNIQIDSSSMSSASLSVYTTDKTSLVSSHKGETTSNSIALSGSGTSRILLASSVDWQYANITSSTLTIDSYNVDTANSNQGRRQENSTGHTSFTGNSTIDFSYPNISGGKPKWLLLQLN